MTQVTVGPLQSFLPSACSGGFTLTCLYRHYQYALHFCRMENLDKMFKLGIYLTDLSMHDVSRDLVLVGTQQSQELTNAFNQVC